MRQPGLLRGRAIVMAAAIAALAVITLVNSPAAEAGTNVYLERDRAGSSSLGQEAVCHRLTSDWAVVAHRQAGGPMVSSASAARGTGLRPPIRRSARSRGRR